MIAHKTNWGGQYPGLSKKQGFLRQSHHQLPHSPSHISSRQYTLCSLSFSHHHLLFCIPALSLLGLIGLTSALFVSADLASNSYALDPAVGLESEVTATVDGTHYVSLTAADVIFSASPTGSTPVTDKQTVNVSVETNVTGGASLYLASTTNTNALYKDGNPTNSNLPHIAASTATVESPTTLDNLSPNTWAYSTDNTNYQGVPTGSDTNDPNLIADINGTTTGTTSGGVTSATIPIYYAAKIDTSIPAGSYASSVTYSAVVDGGIITEATLTKIEIDGAEVDAMQPAVENTLTTPTVRREFILRLRVLLATKNVAT